MEFCCLQPKCGCRSDHEPSPVPFIEPVDSGPAADPVSIGLAFSVNMAKEFSVPESKLSYGFNKIPIDGLPKITKSDIPEEKLWKIDTGKVIEFKKTNYQPQEEEFEEEEEEVVNSNDAPEAYISYGDLGYGPISVKNPRFRTLCRGDPITIESTNTDKQDFSCGFKLGQISQNADTSSDGYLYLGST